MNQRKMKRDHQDSSAGYGAGNNSGIGVTTAKGECSGFSNGKAKMWAEEEQEAAGMDELLAVLGYKVRSSDMAEVAQKLEKLEMVLGSAQEDGISQLSDTVHYNPSDLSGWVQSMLSELNPEIDDNTLLSNTQIPNSNGNQSHVVFHDDSEYDLRAIPGVAAFPPPPPSEEEQNTPKRLKTTTTAAVTASIEPSSSPPSKTDVSESTRAVVLVDSQEAGVRLVHTLMACAEAVQQDNLKLADALVKHVGLLAASQAGAMRKVATYFAEALARRIYGIYPQELLDSSYSYVLQMTSTRRVRTSNSHVSASIRRSSKPLGMRIEFTSSFSALNGGAVAGADTSPSTETRWTAVFRLSGIGPPQPDNIDALQRSSNFGSSWSWLRQSESSSNFADWWLMISNLQSSISGWRTSRPSLSTPSN